jgi:POT family proton-dependent oligopeptide transporter
MMSSLTAENPVAPAAPTRTWFGHPRGLTILFLTETWQEFSYYGMRAILIYYMVEQLSLHQERASVVYGLYTAFVYFTPILGGVISDRWLGRDRAVLIGGSIMAVGHFMMAFEPLFYAALATIAGGNGLFLPSLPSQINGLYAPEDPRRHLAYNYYYVGVNLGGFLAPLGVGTVGELYGWHWGFTLAGIGMLVGLIIYVCGRGYLPNDGSRGSVAEGSQAGHSTTSAATRKRFTLLVAVAAVAVVFRVAYEQVGNTLPLWIEHADRQIGSFAIPMTWFQSLNPLLIFLLTPAFVARWLELARQGREPSALRKMATGALVVCSSYLMLAAVAAWYTRHGSTASWLWLVAFFVVMTTGELFILPVGLGLFGRLAPQRYAATSIALWFFAAFVGNLAAGALGALWSDVSPAEFFCLTAGAAAVSALGLLLLDGPVRAACAQAPMATTDESGELS